MHKGTPPSTVKISKDTTVGSEKPQRKSAAAYSPPELEKGVRYGPEEYGDNAHIAANGPVLVFT